MYRLNCKPFFSALHYPLDKLADSVGRPYSSLPDQQKNVCTNFLVLFLNNIIFANVFFRCFANFLFILFLIKIHSKIHARFFCIFKLQFFGVHTLCVYLSDRPAPCRHMWSAATKRTCREEAQREMCLTFGLNLRAKIKK